MFATLSLFGSLAVDEALEAELERREMAVAEVEARIDRMGGGGLL